MKQTSSSAVVFKVLFLSLMALAALPCRAAENAGGTDQPETTEQRDGRMKWWREARFGMFIHWGIYSVPAGVYHDKKIGGIGEWIMRSAEIPVAEYAGYAKQFNPVKFNADEWVRAAKDAGMKYIVITSKHHDGFAMFHSAVSKYNIYDATPFKRDPLAELAEACRKQDMKLGFYYSQAQDWHHPGGGVYDNEQWDEAQAGLYNDYFKNVAVPQVKEILSNYGPVAVLWWDTPWAMTDERAKLFLPLLKLQPGIITNNRLIQGDPEIAGDTETPEQRIPANGIPGHDWETCMTMNDTWGYKSTDQNWKSAEKLIRNLIDIASKGGNYLLNVGPTSEGIMPEASLDRLKQIGAWMKTNGEAIYGTSASPFRHYSFDGRATVKGNSIYLHVFKWPADGIKVAGIKSKVEKLHFLNGENGEVTVNAQGDIAIAAPRKIDPIATVVELDFTAPPEVVDNVSR